MPQSFERLVRINPVYAPLLAQAKSIPVVVQLKVETKVEAREPDKPKSEVAPEPSRRFPPQVKVKPSLAETEKAKAVDEAVEKLKAQAEELLRKMGGSRETNCPKDIRLPFKDPFDRDEE